MSKILDQYSFNIPKYQTTYKDGYVSDDTSGKCPRKCESCVAFKNQCQGCDFMCQDRYCSSKNCHKCPYLCYRGGERLEKALDTIGGLEIDMSPTKDIPFAFDTTKIKYIPAINKPCKEKFTYPIVSIPFYAIYDFTSEHIISTELHSLFNLQYDTEIIVNFYFKDDKILRIFDYIIESRFFDILYALNKEVTCWHTPCFSVFSMSSSMDCLLNFKRQFWIGDLMRKNGFNTIQEVLYAIQKKKIHASPENAVSIVNTKGIQKISQCGQLNFNFHETLQAEIGFIRELHPNTQWLITGLPTKDAGTYNTLRRNMLFSSYKAQFSKKKKKNSLNNTINKGLLYEF